MKHLTVTVGGAVLLVGGVALTACSSSSSSSASPVICSPCSPTSSPTSSPTHHQNRDQQLWDAWFASSSYTDYRALTKALAIYKSDVDHRDSAALSADATAIASPALSLEGDSPPPPTPNPLLTGQFASAGYETGNDIEISIQTGAPLALDSEYPVAVALQAQIDKLIAAAKAA